jgi:type II secretory pathway pseudopilin PulG
MTTQSLPLQYRNQAGISLMELIAALTVIAAIVVGALALYNSASTTQRATQVLQDVLALRSGVQLLYRSQGGYGAASLTPSLFAAGKVPTTVFSPNDGTDLVSVFGAPITITGAGGTFIIQVNDVPRGACISLATAQSDWIDVTIGGNAAIVGRTLTVAEATAQCNAATGQNDIIFESN